MRTRQANSGLNGAEAQAVENFRTGNTARQRRQAFTDKLIMGGAQAALMGTAGLIKGYEANELEERQKAARVKEAKFEKDRDFNQNLKRDHGPLPDYESDGGEKAGPAWLMGGPVDAKTAAEFAKNNQRINDAAAMTTIGGVSTSDGAQHQADQSSMLGRDQAMGKSLMQSGDPYAPGGILGPARGMMGSIGPEEDYDYYAGQNKG